MKKDIDIKHELGFYTTELDDATDTLTNMVDDVEEIYYDSIKKFRDDIFKELRNINYFERSQMVSPGKVKDHNSLSETVTIEIPENVQRNKRVMGLLKHSQDNFCGGDAFEIEETENATWLHGNGEHMEELMEILKAESNLSSSLMDVFEKTLQELKEAKKKN